MKRNLERRRIHFLKDSHYAFYLRMLWKYALWIWETSSDCSGSFAKISKWEDTRMIHSIVSFEPWSVLMSVTPLFRKARKGFTRWKSPTSNALSTEKSAFKRQAETLSLFRIYEYSFFLYAFLFSSGSMYVYLKIIICARTYIRDTSPNRKMAAESIFFSRTSKFLPQQYCRVFLHFSVFPYTFFLWKILP